MARYFHGIGTTSQWTTREIRAAAIVPPLHGLGQTIVLMPNKQVVVLARPSDIDFSRRPIYRRG
jgi:hypothetical protein